MRMAKGIVVSVIAASGLLGLTACTSSMSKCFNDRCDVNLGGKGANTEIGSSDVRLKLVSAENGTAKLTVDGDEISCTEGQVVKSGGYTVTCTQVGDNDLKLHIDL